MLCTIADPCLRWMPGLGFRRYADEGWQCAIIDTPLEGKTPFEGPGLEILRMFPDTTTVVSAVQDAVTAIAAVPPTSSLGYLISAILCIPVAAVILRFVKVDHEVRGRDSGRPGGDAIPCDERVALR